MFLCVFLICAQNNMIKTEKKRKEQQQKNKKNSKNEKKVTKWYKLVLFLPSALLERNKLYAGRDKQNKVCVEW